MNETVASVREMALKFEVLMQEHGDTASKRIAAQKRLHQRKPIKALPLEASNRHFDSDSDQTAVTQLTDTETTSPPSPPPIPPIRRRKRNPKPTSIHTDDLLYDNLITDRISASIGIPVGWPDVHDNASGDDDCVVDNADDRTLSEIISDKFSIEEEAVQPAIAGEYRVIEELLAKERSYIDTLSRGIDNYILAPEAGDLPLQAVQDHIFSNIIVIRNFHQNTFLPSLEACGLDVEQLCSCFCKHIQDGYFYSYIEYGINRKRAERLCEQNQAYFRRREAEVDDPLGVENFLLQPIQRLPRYQLLLYQLTQHLGTRLKENTDEFRMQIAACCRAEKSIQRLLDRLNQSMTISDIVEFHCNLEFLMLNIAENGEFRIVERFVINDHTRRRRYNGKLFLFDKCVVFTEFDGPQNELLRFRGFYQQAHVGIAFAEDRYRFYLYHIRRGNQEIECETDSAKTFKKWSEALSNMLLSSAGKITWNFG